MTLPGWAADRVGAALGPGLTHRTRAVLHSRHSLKGKEINVQTVRWIVVSMCVVAALAAPARAQKVVAPFDADYHLYELGSVPGVPFDYGGLAFLDNNTLLVGGTSIAAEGALYSVGVVRGEGFHIVGFIGDAVFFSAAAFIDGGVAFGPGGVLFLSRYHGESNMAELGETKPGSAVTDKVVDLSADPLLIPQANGGLNFVPAGFPGAGQLKFVSFGDGRWYSLALADDGMGTFDVTAATPGPTLFNGPEGFFYVPAGSPQFPNPDSVLAAEYFAQGFVVAYQVDASGDPMTATRTEFVHNLLGVQGAVVDPLTGDFLFSTFGDLNHIVNVHPYKPLPCEVDDDCNDHNVCTTDTCDTGLGNCVYVDNDGADCDDGLFCTGTDTCSGGECVVHTGDPCAIGNVCASFCFNATKSCGIAPVGVFCEDDGSLCTMDRCDGAGTCVHAPFVEPNCVQPGPAKASLVVKDNADDTKDSLTFKLSSDAVEVVGDFGDPVNSDDYQLCLFDAADPAPSRKLFPVVPHGGLCGTKPCWKPTKTGFKYANKAGTPQGVGSVVLKLSKTGNPSIVVKGKGAHLGAPAIPLTTPVTAQLKATNGRCWSATFPNATKNASGQFSAKLP